MTDELPRCFEGAQVLQTLLGKSGTLADVEDVAGAFLQAVKSGAPAQLVINALWEDEPHFDSPDEARRLFSNLLGLYDLVEGGGEVDLALPRTFNKRPKAPRPEPFAPAGPDDAFVEAAWRYFDDHPKEHEKLVHRFDHQEDALVGWLEQHGLDDDAFVLARQLVCDVFTMLELGGHRCPSVVEPRGEALPPALASWVDEGVFEAEQHEERPLAEATGTQVRALVLKACAALWA